MGMFYRNECRYLIYYICIQFLLLLLFKTYRNNAYIEPNADIVLRTEMQIKQELDEEKAERPVVNDSPSNAACPSVLVTNTDEVKQLRQQIEIISAEKRKIIADLVETKSIHQRTLFDLHQAEKRNQSMASQIKNLKEEIHSLTKSNADLTNAHLSEITQLKQEINLLRSERKKIVSHDDSEQFEVDRIISHKLKGKKRFFRVHWTGYEAEDDTWEPEENIAHLSMLITYLKENNLA